MTTPVESTSSSTADRRHWFTVQGLDCPDEAAVVRDAVMPLPGVREVIFDYTRSAVCVICAPDAPSATTLANAVTAAGLPTVPLGTTAPTTEVDQRSTTGWFALAGSLLLILGFGIDVSLAGGLISALNEHPLHPVVIVCFIASIAVTWIKLAPRAWAGVRALRADMYVLMVIAVAGAGALGEWMEGATVSVLFLVSLALERWSADRARGAIAALLDLAPTKARLRGSDGVERQVAVEEVPAGTILIVQPGERIPLDGKISEGSSHVNQSALTGESMPVVKNVGDQVFAGTVNGEGMLTMTTTVGAADTTLSRMTRLVAEARSNRGKAERWVDRFSQIYTPVVVVIAVLIAVVPPLLFDGAWNDWIYRALALLVIACPCALVIATPVAVVAALARAARSGVLVKGGEHLEQAASLRVIAYDKTGTLTLGTPRVAALLPAPGESPDHVLAVAAALDARSDHPLARAVVQAASAAGTNVIPASEVRVLPGLGVVGTVGSTPSWIGSPRFAAEQAPQDRWLPTIPAESPGSLVLVGTQGLILGGIVLGDTLRPEAKEVIAQVAQLGITHQVMLTGDDPRVARAVAAQLGLSQVHAGLMPADKVAMVAALSKEHGLVALIGDGVNDAPALARADLGIAMGAAATPAALETADVALLSNDLRRLPWIIQHARRMRWIIWQNVTAALMGKVVFLILSSTGHTSLWVAIAADTGISLLVTINALRLLR
jgi:Zn2+/Cd2+-exporting ATPase